MKQFFAVMVCLLILMSPLGAEAQVTSYSSSNQYAQLTSVFDTYTSLILRFLNLYPSNQGLRDGYSQLLHTYSDLQLNSHASSTTISPPPPPPPTASSSLQTFGRHSTVTDMYIYPGSNNAKIVMESDQGEQVENSIYYRTDTDGDPLPKPYSASSTMYKNGMYVDGQRQDDLTYSELVAAVDQELATVISDDTKRRTAASFYVEFLINNLTVTTYHRAIGELPPYGDDCYDTDDKLEFLRISELRLKSDRFQYEKPIRTIAEFRSPTAIDGSDSVSYGASECTEDKIL